MTNTYQNRLRVALGLQQPTGAWTNGFAYDAALRLTNVTSQAGAFTNVYGTGVGGSSGFSSRLIQRQLLANHSAITNNYDSVARLLATHLRTSAGVLTNKHEYLYNLAGQRTNETRMDGSTVAYRYDNIGQLKVADSSVNAEDRGYAYDTAWNLNWLTNNGTASQFSVNPLNELTNWTDGGCYYDSNGNLTNKATDTFGDRNVYAYDDEDRLIDVQNVSVAYETVFIYDGLGRLRIRQEYQGPPQSRPLGPTSGPTGGMPLVNVVNYIYDGMRVIQERDSNNVPTVSYTRGNDLSGSLEGAGGIGGLLSRSSSYSSGNWTNHAYYHADGNGNITCLLNGSQAVVASYRYDPFGNTLSQSGSLAGANVYRFSSKEVHTNSAMYYYGYRFYDPAGQRWVNRDPIGERGGINLFAIAKNDPQDHVDAYGQFTVNYPCPSLRTCSTFRCTITFIPTGIQIWYLALNAKKLLECEARSIGVMNLGCLFGSYNIFVKGCDSVSTCINLYANNPPFTTPPEWPVTPF